MIKAIKCLEKRIKLLNSEYDKREKDFENCEITSDLEFIQNDLANIELEIIELREAIKTLNNF